LIDRNCGIEVRLGEDEIGVPPWIQAGAGITEEMLWSKMVNSELVQKNLVRDYWNEKSCGEVYARGQNERDFYESHSRDRYELEPYISGFAKFHEGQGKDVL
jgi:hypothetical protein